MVISLKNNFIVWYEGSDSIFKSLEIKVFNLLVAFSHPLEFLGSLLDISIKSPPFTIMKLHFHSSYL